MKIGVQLYTVRDQMNADPAGTLKAIGKMGYRYVEAAGTAGKSTKEFATMARDAGLKFCGMHVGYDQCEKQLDQVLADAEVMDCPYIVVPGLPERAYADGWDRCGIRLQKFGEKVAKAKRKFGFHNHSGEFVKVGDRTAYEIMTESSCPDHMLLEVDLWWAHCGGQDVPGLLKAHGERVHLVHLKDGTSCRAETHVPAGQGEMDWPPVLKQLDACKTAFGIVEFDSAAGDPLAAIKASLLYFRTAGYKG
ncbi:MAG: sugar phosphate isomerase/epimerase [Armatimonadetes bacterium]|nr:sugar phosphate isomerase/epimerase [Armatimonadota bacterium]